MAVLSVAALVASAVYGIYSMVTDRTGEKVTVDGKFTCTIMVGNAVAQCPNGFSADSYEYAMKIRKNMLDEGCALSPMPYAGEYSMSYGHLVAEDLRRCYHK